MKSALLKILVIMLAFSSLRMCAYAADEATETSVTVKKNRMANIASIMGQDKAATSSTTERKEPYSTGTAVLRMIQGLGIVAGMFLIGAHYYKKFALKNAPQFSRKIKILERSSLGGKRGLVLAEVDGQRILVGMGGNSLSLIKLDAPTVKLEEVVEEGSEDLWFALQKSSA